MGPKYTQKNIPTTSFARGGNNVAQGNVPQATLPPFPGKREKFKKSKAFYPMGGKESKGNP